MDIDRLCSTLKERLAAELQEADGPARREALLIEGLYELSRSVLPRLGQPKKSQEYAEKQGAVLNLISFIAIPLIKSAQTRRGIAVLSEVGEGCLDPLLRKKFSVYALELMARFDIESAAPSASAAIWRRIAIAAASSAAAMPALYIFWGVVTGEHGSMPAAPAATQESSPPSSTTYRASGLNSSMPAVASAPIREIAESVLVDRSPQEPRGALTQCEQVTRMRVVNNQVLVPVTLKNGGESVRLELVLDTGATRTAVHEHLAAKLRIDLRSTKISQSEVADGRLISSRVARIDALVVGPFAMPADVELISYKGTEGVHDGLLGMDFLAKHRYQIDMERELIRWF